jgi:hypothetical protein
MPGTSKPIPMSASCSSKAVCQRKGATVNAVVMDDTAPCAAGARCGDMGAHDETTVEGA